MANYVALNYEDWLEIESINDPKQKFEMFKRRILYFGLDATGGRPSAHNVNFYFNGIDARLWQWWLRNEKNVVILFDEPKDHDQLMFVFESIMIDQARHENIEILNITVGNDIKLYITDFGS